MTRSQVSRQGGRTAVLACIAGIASLAAAGRSALAQGRPTLYIPRTVNRTLVPGIPNAKETIEAILTTAVSTSARCATQRTMSQSEAAALMNFEKMQKLLAGTDTDVSEDIMSAVAATYVLASEIEYSGTHTLTLALIDAKHSTVVARSTRQTKAPEDVPRLVDKAVADLDLIELLCPWRGTITIRVDEQRDTTSEAEERGPPTLPGGPPAVVSTKSREGYHHAETWTIEKTGRTRTSATGSAEVEHSTIVESTVISSGILCAGDKNKWNAKRSETTRSAVSLQGGGKLDQANVTVSIADSGSYSIAIQASGISAGGETNYSHTVGDDCYPTKTDKAGGKIDPMVFTLPPVEITGSGYKKGDRTLASSKTIEIGQTLVRVKWQLTRE
jgi:hypothetical protein